jgi:hypothetical protein
MHRIFSIVVSILRSPCSLGRQTRLRTCKILTPLTVVAAVHLVAAVESLNLPKRIEGIHPFCRFKVFLLQFCIGFAGVES